MVRAAGWLFALVVSALAAVLAAPDRLALTTTAPVTQLIAFRTVLGLGSLGLGLLVLLAMRIRRHRRRGSPGSRWDRGARTPDRSGSGFREPRASPRGSQSRATRRRRATPVGVAAAVLLVTGAVHLGVVAGRGVVNGVPLLASAAAADRSQVLTVLSFNTLGAVATPGEVAEVAERAGADVLMLPETPPEAAAELAAALSAAGRPVQVFSNDRGFSRRFSTSLLVSYALGRYVEVPTRDGAGYVRADPLDGAGPPLVAVHPVAPVAGHLDRWLRELEYAVELCRLTPGAVVGGDFNATLDHGPMGELGRCADAASAPGLGGAGAHGTWHARLPSLLGVPIDHVLFDSDAWRVLQVGVLPIGESDHRAVLATLERR